MKILYVGSCHPKLKAGIGVGTRMHEMMVRKIANNEYLRVYYCRETLNITDQYTFYVRGSVGRQKIVSVIHGINPLSSKQCNQKILDIIADHKIDIVFIDTSTNGVLVKQIKKQNKETKVVAFFHDIEAIRMVKERHTSVFRKLSLPVYIMNEKLTVQYADKTLVFNERDAQLYRKLYKKSPNAIVPVSAPEVSSLNREIKHFEGRQLDLLFIGAKYAPNVDGLRWFISNVMPIVNSVCCLCVVGLRMEEFKEEFEGMSNNVEVIGTVDSLEPYYEKADVVIGPMFEGGGMKVKVAEAFLHGKRFIGCSESLMGYWESVNDLLKNKMIFKADDCETFAAYIKFLFNETFPKNDIKIKEWADALYTNSANIDIFRRVFEECVI